MIMMIIVKYIIYKCKGEPMYHKPLAHKLNLNAPAILICVKKDSDNQNLSNATNNYRDISSATNST